MIASAINRLEYLCDNIPPLLSAIDELAFSRKPTPDKWSKKEIIGHLIDSATNNHHRIVRGQFEHRPKIAYDNHVWNKGNHYEEMTAQQVISFWAAYNRHLLEVIKHIAPEKLSNEVEPGEPGDNNIMTLAEVIIDYVDHMEHHLRQVV